jgi:hypothetical protein
MLRPRPISFVVTVALALSAATETAQAAETATRTLTSAGEHSFVVPAGVASLHVTLVGGNGGAGAGGAAGGVPASVGATLAVSPGQTLYAEVAGDGGAATAPDSALGGYGGGEGGGEVFALFGTAPSGGGGGGASDIRTCSASATPACGSLASRLVVAGGGGGGGGPGISKTTPLAGGAGGAAEFPGTNGAGDGGDAVGGAGGAATPNLGGAAGGGNGETKAGMLGLGGAPGDSAIVGGAGGGGAGGLYGGGGGGAGGAHIVGAAEGFGSGGGGGGGGSSGVPAGAPGVSGFTLLATAHGAEPQIAISWTMPPPATLTGTPSAVTSTGATLGGSVNPDGSQLSDCHFTISPAPVFGGSLPCSQQVAAVEVPVAVSAQISGLAPTTTYTVTLNATSAQGTSAGAPVTFTTSPASSGTGPGPVNTGPPLDSLGVSDLKLSPTRFYRGTRPATIARKTKKKAEPLPTSTTISFALSQAATINLSFELAQPGMLVGRKCDAISKAHRKGKRCTRYTAVHSGVTRAGHAGTDKIAFAGVLDGGVRLAPGTYRLSLGATGPGGSATAAQRPSFTLLG